jgi:hypothetical protein
MEIALYLSVIFQTIWYISLATFDFGPIFFSTSIWIGTDVMFGLSIANFSICIGLLVLSAVKSAQKSHLKSIKGLRERFIIESICLHAIRGVTIATLLMAGWITFRSMFGRNFSPSRLKYVLYPIQYLITFAMSGVGMACAVAHISSVVEMFENYYMAMERLGYIGEQKRITTSYTPAPMPKFRRRVPAKIAIFRNL